MSFFGELSAFIFLTWSAGAVSTVEERDRLSTNAVQRAADQWLVELHEALQCRSHKDVSAIPRDQCPNRVPMTYLASTLEQERIYKLLLNGLVCNHHRMAVCERIEPFLIRAIHLIKSNDLIFSKMMTNPKNMQSPFQRLYWWADCCELREALDHVARVGRWDVAKFGRVKHNEMIDHQQFLQSIKQCASANHQFTWCHDPLLETLRWSKSYFIKLTDNNPTSWTLEIVMTFFQLLIDIRPYVAIRYIHSTNFSVNRYYSLMVQYIAELTMKNLKLAMKAVDILLDKAPDLIWFLWRERKMYRNQWDISDGSDMQLHDAEMYLILIDTMAAPAQLLIPISRYFNDSKNDIERQRQSRGGNCGSLHYFHIKLLLSTVKYCREVGITDNEWIHVANMIWCTTKLVHFDVEVQNSTDGLINQTYFELLDKYDDYKNRDLHLPDSGITLISV